MTFDQLREKTLAVFPNALLTEDGDGNIVIEPGYYEVPGKTELGEYNPAQKEVDDE